MAMQDEKSVLAEIRKVKWYAEQFKKAFPEAKDDPVTMDNLAKAIGAFERKLVTPSRWDKFLGGDKNALTAAEKRGFKKFTETGCNTCHAGPYLGGAMYQKLGLVKPWDKQDDLGRYEVTKQDVDKMMFKVPSLRNVEKTAPYFHDGSTATLAEAVKEMAEHQLGKDLSDADVASIIAFLKALTGEIPKDYVAEYKVPNEIPPAPKPGPTTAPPGPAKSRPARSPDARDTVRMEGSVGARDRRLLGRRRRDERRSNGREDAVPHEDLDGGSRSASAPSARR
jgi:cytochrome c peroxidase